MLSTTGLAVESGLRRDVVCHHPDLVEACQAQVKARQAISDAVTAMAWELERAREELRRIEEELGAERGRTAFSRGDVTELFIEARPSETRTNDTVGCHGWPTAAQTATPVPDPHLLIREGLVHPAVTAATTETSDSRANRWPYPPSGAARAAPAKGARAPAAVAGAASRPDRRP
ncbi:hypothetical protein STBA_37450 [Streptomyces sp. MP131-18]|nr:hypothetical protein STBA_37450 [Streptomyces sp. MP131-18]